MENSLELAQELHKFGLQESPPESFGKSKSEQQDEAAEAHSKHEAKVSAQRHAGRHSVEALHDAYIPRDNSTVANGDEDYVMDVYVIEPENRDLRTTKTLTTAETSMIPLPAPESIGIIVLAEDEEELWREFAELEDDEDAENNSEEEDENGISSFSRSVSSKLSTNICGSIPQLRISTPMTIQKKKSTLMTNLAGIPTSSALMILRETTSRIRMRTMTVRIVMMTAMVTMLGVRLTIDTILGLAIHGRSDPEVESVQKAYPESGQCSLDLPRLCGEKPTPRGGLGRARGTQVLRISLSSLLQAYLVQTSVTQTRLGKVVVDKYTHGSFCSNDRLELEVKKEMLILSTQSTFNLSHSKTKSYPYPSTSNARSKFLQHTTIKKDFAYPVVSLMPHCPFPFLPLCCPAHT